MELVLSRKGPLAVRDQLAAQIQLKILSGELGAGQKLPSVRGLARRLRIHANTVSAAYKRLTESGWLSAEQGSGLYVRRGIGVELLPEQPLEDVLQLALRVAFRQGYSADEIRGALDAWMSTPPPHRIVVFDTNQETADLLVYEIQQRLRVPTSSCLLSAAHAGRWDGVLAVTWPPHLETLQRLAPATPVAAVTLQISAETASAIVSVPPGGVALVVSHSPRVLGFAASLLSSTRGDDVVAKCHPLSDVEVWRRLAPAAHVIFADAMSSRAVRRVHDKNVLEFRLVSDSACADLEQRISFATPRVCRPPGTRPRRSAECLTKVGQRGS